MEAAAVRQQGPPVGREKTRTAAISTHRQGLKNSLKLINREIRIDLMGMEWRVKARSKLNIIYR